jgi:hypothetical protein
MNTPSIEQCLVSMYDYAYLFSIASASAQSMLLECCTGYDQAIIVSHSVTVSWLPIPCTHPASCACGNFVDTNNLRVITSE